MPTPTSTPKKHRLFVAFPVFAGLVIASLSAGVHESMRAEVIEDRETVEAIEEGTKIVASSSLMQLRAHSHMLKGWNGGFQVTMNDESFTVAAVTTPVLVSHNGHQTIVPAMSQWDSKDLSVSLEDDIAAWRAARKTSPLPEHFVRELLPVLSDMREAEDASPLDELQLLDGTFVDADLWLIAQFHPLIRDKALVMGIPDAVTDEQKFLPLMLLPASDHVPDAIAELSVKQWADRWGDELAMRKDAAAFLESVLPMLHADILQFDPAVFPQRREQYATFISQIAQPFAWRFSEDSKGLLSTLIAIDVEAPLSETEAEQIVTFAKEEPAPPAIPFVASDTQAAMKARLQQLGFMFMASTQVLAKAVDHVEVQDVVLGTVKGDRQLTFTYDPLGDAVSDIVEEGAVLPYSLPLEKYVEWVRGK